MSPDHTDRLIELAEGQATALAKLESIEKSINQGFKFFREENVSIRKDHTALCEKHDKLATKVAWYAGAAAGIQAIIGIIFGYNAMK